MKQLKTGILVSVMALSSNAAFAQGHEITRYVPETDPAALAKLDQWQDLKFGLMMHWGAYSQWGIVESWSICAEDEGWCVRKSDSDYTRYKKKYEALQTTFNPVKFAPGRWARAAKHAGMKYVVFTTKHHDGYCMFDSKHTDYKITGKQTPFHRHPKANITREIFEAFRAEGMWTGAYFSKPDWHNENYWWPNFATPDRNANYSIKNHPERWEKFVQFTHNQIMELMTDYGKVDILWLDGGWVRKRSDDEIRDAYRNMNPEKPQRVQNQDIRMDELVNKARAKQPGLIVVDRAVPGKNQNYLTPENKVPEKELPYPWESCIIAGESWSWIPDAKYLSARDTIHMLVDIVSKGGNLLLNIAPGPDGALDDDAYTLLSEVGDWMQVNGKGIYGTRAIAPYRDGKVCFLKKGETTRYAIYQLAEGEAAPGEIRFSGLQIPAKATARLLGVDGELQWQSKDGTIRVSLPQQDPPSKLALTLEFSW
ncbi:MAG: alpha-L-fucosidase [Akkermansiaceae bacterium]|nr:alpha-L-fucosidase [Akkermansiaceae bacterium]